MSANGFMLGLCVPADAIKGKPIIALYKFAKEYREDMNVDALTKFVVQSIYDTSQIDGDVGGKIKIAIISNEGLRLISDKDVKSSREEWEMEELKRLVNE